MSEVISFRLDRNNPREAQALAVLSAWQETGYSVRHVLTEALLRLEDGSQTEQENLPVEEIVAALERVTGQLERLQREDLRSQLAEAPEASLEEAFLLSVKEVARPGLALGD